MPTYAYACTECDHAMEVRQSFSDDALTTCPACGGRLRKRFDNVGIVFKGSGFYRNDSRSSGESAASAKSEAGGSSSEGSSAGSSSGSSGGNGTGTSSSGNGGSAAPAPAKSDAAKTPKAPTPAS